MADAAPNDDCDTPTSSLGAISTVDDIVGVYIRNIESHFQMRFR